MEQINFAQFVTWGFLALLSGSVAYATSKIGKMSDALMELKQQFAALATDHSWIKEMIKEMKSDNRARDSRGRYAKEKYAKRPKRKTN